MTRQAILLGNTAESDVPSLSVPSPVLQRKLKEVQNVLSRLGDYSFEVFPIQKAEFNE